MTSDGRARPVEILRVKDNPGDDRLTRETLQDSKVSNRITVAEDGDKALALFRGQEPNAEAHRPDLIILDLNLPGKDGREVLAEIKKDPQLKRIPVVILTTSHAEQDIVKSYDLHANAYVTKPLDLDRFIHVVESVQSFWRTIVTLPSA